MQNVAKAQKEIERLDAEADGVTVPNGKHEEGVVASAVESVNEAVSELVDGVKAMASGENKS